jgi:hypothetical protein
MQLTHAGGEDQSLSVSVVTAEISVVSLRQSGTEPAGNGIAHQATAIPRGWIWIRRACLVQEHLPLVPLKPEDNLRLGGEQVDVRFSVGGLIKSLTRKAAH